MTGALAFTELLIASIVERFLVFYPRYQPGDLDVLIKRQLWHQRVRLPRMVVVPNRFSVALDADAYNDFNPILGVLAQELRTSLEAYCKDRGFQHLGPFEIDFEPSTDLKPGRVQIDCQIVEGAGK